jgi:hypothetical protein
MRFKLSRRTRGFIAILGLLTLLFGSSALAQEAGSRVVYAQSVPVTALDPARGAFLAYPAGYEVDYLPEELKGRTYYEPPDEER